MEKKVEYAVNEPVRVYAVADNIISSLGFTTHENMGAISLYASGVKRFNHPNLYPRPMYMAPILPKRFNNMVGIVGLEKYCRLEQMFLLSLCELQVQTSIDFTLPDIGVIFSTTKGNIDLLAPDPTARPEALYLQGMAQRICDYFGMKNPPIVISQACISGIAAVITAKRLIEAGVYRHVLVLGGDLLSTFVLSGFDSFKSLCFRVCRPYDETHDGLSLGEACGSLLLSSDVELVHDRQQAVVVEGGAITNDANHISAPSRTGDGLSAAILQAMEETGLRPEHISFVNTHGTGTVYNDEMEAQALHLAGLQDVPVNSLKSYWGHTLGASGVIESIACIAQLRRNMLWGTNKYKVLGVSRPLVVSGEHRPMEMKRCIKTASGFGGCNAAVVFSLETYAGRKRRAGDSATLTGSCLVKRNRVVVRTEAEHVYEFPELEYPQLIRLMYKELGQPNMRFSKMDDLCKLGYIAMEYFMKHSTLKERYRPEDIGILLANTSSSLETDMEHQRLINDRPTKEASPSVFVYTLPNIVLGEICIRHNFRGENMFFVSKEFNREEMEDYARLLIEQGAVKACFFGWCEWDGNQHDAAIYLLESNEQNNNIQQ